MLKPFPIPLHLLQFFFDVRNTRDRMCALIVVAVCLYGGASIDVARGGPMVDANLARFHRSLPFGVWAVLQPWPSMYNFENTWSIASTTANSSGPSQGKEVYVRHHLASFIYGDLRTLNPSLSKTCRIYLLRSRYRDRSLTTTYEGCPSGDGKTLTLTLRSTTRSSRDL